MLCGLGDCAAPACDCGTKPCGFYLWNHSSTTVVKGQSFQGERGRPLALAPLPLRHAPRAGSRTGVCKRWALGADPIRARVLGAADWFIHSYMFNEVGSSDLVSGFFWDDQWPADGHFGDSNDNIVEVGASRPSPPLGVWRLDARAWAAFIGYGCGGAGPLVLS